MRSSIFLILLSSILSAEQYVIMKSTFSGIGGGMSSQSYILLVAGAQSVTGESSDTIYIEQAGFYTSGTIIITEVKEETGIPRKYFLGIPYPNPARSSVTLRYGVPVGTDIELRVYDLSGRLVTTLVHGTKQPGYYTLELNFHGFPAGIYFILMRVDKLTIIRKLILLR